MDLIVEVCPTMVASNRGLPLAKSIILRDKSADAES